MNIFKLVGSIFVDTDQANDSLSKTDKKAETIGEKLGKVGKSVATVGTAVVGTATALGGAIVNMASKSATAADTIDKGSQRMSISAESYQELAHAAGLSGVEMSTLEKAAKKLEGTDLNLDQALEEIYALGTAEERSAKAAKLFGESVAYTLSPMLNATGEDMAAMRQEAHDLGLVMSDEAVKSGASLNDTLSNVKDAFGAIILQLGVSLMPVVQEFAGLLLQFLPTLQQGIEIIGPLLANLFLTLMPPLMELAQQLLPILTDVILPTMVNLLTAIMPILGPIVQLLTPLIQLIMTLLTPLLDLINLILPPIIELGTALATLLAETIGKAVDLAIKIFNRLKDSVKTVFEQIKEFVRRPINAVIGFINGLIRGITGGINGVIRALNRFQIKVPNWITTLTGISTFGFNLAEVSAPQIPLLARGADIQEEGAAVVGEAGAELLQLPKGARVTPLDSGSGSLDSKMDEIIALLLRLISILGGMGIYLDGDTLVGKLGQKIDKELGRIAGRAERWA